MFDWLLGTEMINWCRYFFITEVYAAAMLVLFMIEESEIQRFNVVW
jgi:hypothetical protein